MKTTHIRAHGDREYWDKVALYARRKKTSIAALVKDAVDRAYGDEIEAGASLFLADAVAIQQQATKPDHA